MAEAPPLRAPAGYGSIVLLDRQAHAGLGIVKGPGYAWAGRLNAAVLGVAELARATLDYPIAFIRGAQGDDVPVAVLGLRDAENLFVDARGHWSAERYVPASLRQHPFCLVERAAPASGVLVAVEAACLGRCEAPLFDARGEPTAAWTPWKSLLDALDASRRSTRSWTAALRAHGLLVPFDALTAPPGQPTLRLGGLHRVDEQALAALPGATLGRWAASGALRAIYAHLVSLENFARLMALSAQHRDRAIVNRP